MTRVNRRQFLILALGFTGSVTLPKAIPIAAAIGRPPRMVRPPRAYGVRSYGQGAYGSGAESILEPSSARTDPVSSD